MRSDPPRFMRPRVPRIDSYFDRLETELRDEIKRNPPRGPRRVQRAFDRVGRMILRPVFHGASIAILLVVVVALRPQPTALMDDVAQSDIGRAPVWAEVIEVPDPSPKLVPFVLRERAARFVAFAVSPVDAVPDPPVGLAPL
jgi:hypothetical protein